MPDLYSHSEFVMKLINDSDKPFNNSLAKVGSQGPDPMYYNAFRKESPDSIFYADRMHDTNTRMLLTNMVHYLKSHNDIDTYSYVFGFLSHYALDVCMHPYVYYNVGDYIKNKPETHIYRGLHKKFETAIDRQIMELDGINPRKISLHKTHYPLKTLPDNVISMFDYTLKNTYGYQNGGALFVQGVKSMYHNIKYMAKDRFGIKKLIYSFLDLFHKNSLFYKDISYFSYIRKYDYVNNKQSTWHHPITNEAFTKSVYDLKEDAYTFFQNIIKEVDKYLNNEDVDLDKVFLNLSFNSGMECTCKDQMQHFKKYN